MDRAKLHQMSVDELWTLHLEISDALLLLEERLNQVRAPSVRARAVPSVPRKITAILITSIASSDEADTVHSRTSYSNAALRRRQSTPLTFHRRDSGSASAGAITRTHHHVSAGIPSIWSIWFWLRW